MGYGIVQGILAALEIPTTFVKPQRWGKLVVLPANVLTGASRKRASELFPRDAGLFARVGDHGRADAALIALAGYRIQTPAK
jgi:hypothetical protein